MRKNIAVIAFMILNLCISTVYAGRVGYVTTRPATAVENTPKENLFSINGSGLKFILLDTDAEGMFCTTREFYGTQPFDPDGTGKFDIEDENNIAYWLNNTFLEKGGEMWSNSKRDDTFPFPELIVDYLIERDWPCEAGYESSDYSEDYTVRAKLALMSVTEWKKYNSKIGYADNQDIALYYWLRSVNGTIDPGVNAPVMVVSAGGTAQFGKVRNGYGVRPVFYLSRDFFTEVKTDISLLGDNVKKALRENFTREELRRVYSQSELEKIYEKLPPQAGGVAISGITQTGSVLKATYTYHSPESEPEGESEYRWLRSKNKNGPYSVISGENSLEFRIRDIDEGYYFAFEVVPKSPDKVGVAVRSKATAEVASKDILCTAENVRIDGNALIGERLIARYNYYDANMDVEDGTLIRWQMSNDGNEFSDIPDAIGLNYTIPADLDGKYIRFTINVKSLGSNIYGETVVSEAIGPIMNEVVDNNITAILDNGVAKIISPIISGRDIPFWTVYSKEGNLLSVETGGIEYELNDKDVLVKAGVWRTGDNILGRIFYSEILEFVDKQSLILKDTIEINSEDTIYLKSMGNEYAHSLEVYLECNGVNVTKAESENYDAYVLGTENTGVFLVGKDSSQIIVPENVVKLDVSGKGTIKIIHTKGVYEIGDKIIDNELNIFFE